MKDENQLRHPTDSLTWKTLDSLHSNFTLDPQNLSLV